MTNNFIPDLAKEYIYDENGKHWTGRWINVSGRTIQGGEVVVVEL